MTFSVLPVLLASSFLLSPSPSAQTAPAAKPAAAKPAAKADAAKPVQTAKPAAKGARTVELTAGDDMKFSLATIEAKPGETIHLVLKSTGTMPKIAMAHNVIVLVAGTDPAAFSNAAMMARATDFVPADKKAQVLASTPLAGPGETVETTFKAPAKAGSFDYLCSFPGHFAAGMKGKLVVK